MFICYVCKSYKKTNCLQFVYIFFLIRVQHLFLKKLCQFPFCILFIYICMYALKHAFFSFIFYQALTNNLYKYPLLSFLKTTSAFWCETYFTWHCLLYKFLHLKSAFFFFFVFRSGEKTVWGKKPATGKAKLLPFFKHYCF